MKIYFTLRNISKYVEAIYFSFVIQYSKKRKYKWNERNFIKSNISKK